MAGPAISVQGVWKEYVRGQLRAPYETFREMLSRGVRAPISRIVDSKALLDRFWALKDIDFEVHPGEVVGVIGRNGAGKSTLLKVLSRITEPTRGKITLRGRVASLLEVGTGFHPELTGRENIFLNAAILGMRRREVLRRFDEIVDFAEIETFLDTPVKRYSSGMYIRLAFSVAAHLEPEILLVDEVLAVGDAAFQQRCLGKMENATQAGKAVVLVSHNMGAIRKLCGRGIVLEDARAESFADIDGAIAAYYGALAKRPGNEVIHIADDFRNRSRNEGIQVESIVVTSSSGDAITSVHTGDALKFSIGFRSVRRIASAAFVVSCRTDMGVEVFRLTTSEIPSAEPLVLGGAGEVELGIDALPLLGGTYYFDIGVARARMGMVYMLDRVIRVDVTPTDVYGSGLALGRGHGLVSVSHRWRLNSTSHASVAAGE